MAQYTYNFTANGYTASIVFTTEDVTRSYNPGLSLVSETGYRITGISGSFAGQSITGLLPSNNALNNPITADTNGTGGDVGLYDNVLWKNSTQGNLGQSYLGIDDTGVAFTAGGVDYKIFKPTLSTDTYAYTGGETISAPLTFNAAASSPAGTACFLGGTRIRVSRDGVEVETAIEDLAAGDLAVTASGAHRPIRWVGHSILDARHRGEPVELVRITAGAIGPGRPLRDLVVTPPHAVALDLLGEVLVPADRLVNGATIVRETVERVTVWHVELDSHDLVVADGQPAESFLDMGNRGAFSGGTVVDLALHPDGDSSLRTHADFCRPYHADGPFVAVVRAQLRRRAREIGWRLSDPSVDDAWTDVHLEVDGRIVRPTTRGPSARFELPAASSQVWLVSPARVPWDVSDSPDGRALGLYLAGIRLDDGWCEPRAVALDDPLLEDGLHPAEGEAHMRRRWTSGRARLPAELWAGLSGTVSLRLDLEASVCPRWVAPTVVGEVAQEADEQVARAA